MQSIAITPAEKLLRRLEKTEDFLASYAITVEKSEGHTCLYIRFSPAEFKGSLRQTNQQGSHV